MAFSASGAVGLIMRVPTALFPMALGISGLGALMNVAGRRFDNDALGDASILTLMVATIVLSIEVVCYVMKLLRHRDEVVEDWTTATRANLLAPGFMASMVIGGTLAWDFPTAGLLWLIASIGHFILLVGFIGRWLTHEYSPDDLNPTWFLPAAGLLTAPMTWPGIGPDIWPLMLFGIGSLLWLMLLPLVFRRLTFEPAVSPQLRPTLFIVVAPFGLFAGAVHTLFSETLAPLALITLSSGTLFTLVLVTQFRFLSKAGVTLSWWASTFPVTALASSAWRTPANAESNQIIVALGAGLAALACVTTIVALLATIRAAWCTCRKTVAGTEREIEAMHGLDV